MNKKRMFINLAGQLSSFACNLGINLLLTPYIVSHLGEETYGFVGLANNFTSYITLFTIAITGMLSRYVTIEYSKNNYEKASGYFSTAFFSQAILSLVLIVPMVLFTNNLDSFVSVSENIVGDVRILWLLIFISFLVGLPFSGFTSAAFAKNRLEITSIVNIISNLVRMTVLIITFVFFTPYVWYVGLATIIAGFVTIISNVTVKRKILPEVKISIKHFNKKYIHDLLVVGIWNSLNKLQQILCSGVDLLIANLFINGSEMGILSIAKTVPTQITTLIGTVSWSFDSALTIAYTKEDKSDFIKQTKYAMKFSGFLGSIPVIGFIAFGMDFFKLWVPTMSESDITKIYILSILTMLPEVFSVYVYPLYTVNLITTKLKTPVLLSVGIGVLNIVLVLILLLTTDLGIYAVAGVSSVLWTLRILLFVPTYAAHSLGIKLTSFFKPLINGIINTVLVGALMIAVSNFTDINSWTELILVCLPAGLVGYVICFFVVFDKEEKVSALSTIRKKIKR